MMMKTALAACFMLLQTTRAAVSPEIIENLIEWVTSAEHGYWNSEKIEIRRADGADYLGVFAKADIEPNETLMQIPPERYIHIIGDALPTQGDEPVFMQNYWKNVCKLATKLESLLATTSSNGYLDYLKAQPPGQLPVAWSQAGKERLRQILPPVNRVDVLDWIDANYDFCNADHHWIAMTIQRGYDVALIPIWDMVNHDNGKVNVGSSSYYDSTGIRVWADQPIQAGQEIYASYDMCYDCADVAEYWGTTEILRDFGFVEDYPQRWTWEDGALWFEIHKDEDSGDLSVVWDDAEGMIPGLEHEYAGPAKGDGLEFLRRELTRLQSLKLTEDCTAPSHECWFIQRYFDSIVTALTLAIEAAETAGDTCVPPSASSDQAHDSSIA